MLLALPSSPKCLVPNITRVGLAPLALAAAHSTPTCLKQQLDDVSSACLNSKVQRRLQGQQQRHIKATPVGLHVKSKQPVAGVSCEHNGRRQRPPRVQASLTTNDAFQVLCLANLPYMPAVLPGIMKRLLMCFHTAVY